MSVFGSRPAVTKISTTSKTVGKDENRVHRVGSRCAVERSAVCFGEFLVWFPGRRYVKVNAIDLPDVVRFTDGKSAL